MSMRASQQGVTLLVTIVMLIMVTLFVTAAIRLANINLRIVGNAQWQREMEVLADSAIEQFISSSTNFSAASVALERDICADGRLVSTGSCTLILNPKIGTLTFPRCLATSPAKGYTIKLGEIPPEDSTFRLTATVADSWSGASVTITRGVSIRQLTGNCPE